MLIDHSREKLINAIAYFVGNTQFCGKLKLFKLLYFLDFLHFKEIGRSVTGLDYQAWQMGPVPVKLKQEIENNSDELTGNFEINWIPTAHQNKMLSLKPKIEFDSSTFSRRELRIMQELVEKYYNYKAKDMTEESHLENQPWDIVYNQDKNTNGQIPYAYVINSVDREARMAEINENRKFWDRYKQ